jgi:hypothetical protein
MPDRKIPRTVTRTRVRGSIGERETDYIKLENKFARVTITRDIDDADGKTPRYHVTGDVYGGPCQCPFSTPDAGAAMAYALECLAAYVRGRAD